MKELAALLVSVHTGNNEDLSKEDCASAEVELEGFVGDKHRGFERVAWPGDKDPAGTVRRNERQWSGVSVEELAIIEQKMDLKEPLTAAVLGANLCVEGIPDFSRLPSGTRLLFPSGAVLVVEECNPPCSDMGEQITAKYTTRSGERARNWARRFSEAPRSFATSTTPVVSRSMRCTMKASEPLAFR